MGDLGGDLMGKTILVTGANGFVGRNLLNALESSDWDIIPLVHRESGLSGEIVLDFCSEDFNQQINMLPEVDVIVHVGAKIGWDKSQKPALFIPNVLATAEMVKWAKKISAYFLFASTAIVCGVRNPHITSESKPNPDTDYGYSKWLAEEMIRMSGVEHAILRIAGVFGRGGPQHLGLNKAIDGALNGETPMQYGSGKIKRNYIYVEDLVNVIIYCMANQVEGTHLVAGSSVNTVAEMLQIICDKSTAGSHPKYLEGVDGQDQVITHSASLPKGRSFSEAIEHIYERYVLL